MIRNHSLLLYSWTLTFSYGLSCWSASAFHTNNYVSHIMCFRETIKIFFIEFLKLLANESLYSPPGRIVRFWRLHMQQCMQNLFFFWKRPAVTAQQYFFFFLFLNCLDWLQRKNYANEGFAALGFTCQRKIRASNCWKCCKRPEACCVGQKHELMWTL